MTAQIPTILADNAGYDSSDLVAKLRAAHYEGRKDAGLGASGRPLSVANVAIILFPRGFDDWLT